MYVTTWRFEEEPIVYISNQKPVVVTLDVLSRRRPTSNEASSKCFESRRRTSNEAFPSASWRRRLTSNEASSKYFPSRQGTNISKKKKRVAETTLPSPETLKRRKTTHPTDRSTEKMNKQKDRLLSKQGEEEVHTHGTAWVCPVEHYRRPYNRKYDFKYHFYEKISSNKIHQDLVTQIYPCISVDLSTKKNKKHVCPISTCPSGYSRLCDLRNHFVMYHSECLPDYPHLKPVQIFSCPFCFRLFAREKLYQSHHCGSIQHVDVEGLTGAGTEIESETERLHDNSFPNFHNSTSDIMAYTSTTTTTFTTSGPGNLSQIKIESLLN